VPLQQVAAHGTNPGNSAKATPGDPIAIIVRVPPAYISKPVNIAIDRTGPTTFVATTTVAATSLHASSQIQTSVPGLQIASLRWKCVVPGGTFCPVHTPGSSSNHVKLSLHSHGIPVELSAIFDRPGATPAPSLLPLGLPAPGSPDQATVKVTAVAPVARGKRPPSPAPPSSSATAAPGATLQVVVQLLQGSPASGTLRIAIPRASGKSISIQAGGTAQQPASTATVTSTGKDIRVVGAVYDCSLPPATFCPFSSTTVTGTGLVLTLPTPRVPVTLTLPTANA
jgi:hypothetical protein